MYLVPYWTFLSSGHVSEKLGVRIMDSLNGYIFQSSSGAKGLSLGAPPTTCLLGCSASRGRRQTFSCLSKLGGTTNLIRLLFGPVK